MNTITKESLAKIIETADEILAALSGTNEDVHPDNSTKMCRLWDDLNDTHAPPEVVREMARMLLAAQSHIAELEAAPPAPVGPGEEPVPVIPDFPGKAMTQRECYWAGWKARDAALNGDK